MLPLRILVRVAAGRSQGTRENGEGEEKVHCIAREREGTRIHFTSAAPTMTAALRPRPESRAGAPPC
jgi:hypothetical protein